MNGILIISSKAEEWMLPWWWMHYHFHNSLPVAFIDRGISLQAKQWCAKRGDLIPFASADKPKAMLLSPFEKTLLIDPEAQVCSPLAPLFELPLPPSGMALSENSTAVILFERGSNLLQKWAQQPDFLKNNPQASALPKKYNWGAHDPHCADAGIVHWAGPDKSSIRGAIAVCEKLLMNLSFEEA